MRSASHFSSYYKLLDDTHIVVADNDAHRIISLFPPLSFLSCCIQLFHIALGLCEDSVVGIILFIAHDICTQAVIEFGRIVLSTCME